MTKPRHKLVEIAQDLGSLVDSAAELHASSSSTLLHSTKNDESNLHRALARFAHLPDTAFVRQPTVQALFGISAASVWRWVKSGRLPPPELIGPRAKGWRAGAIRKALER